MDILVHNVDYDVESTGTWYLHMLRSKLMIEGKVWNIERARYALYKRFWFRRRARRYFCTCATLVGVDGLQLVCAVHKK